MSVYLGAKEIYCDVENDALWHEVDKFCSEDSPESVELYKKFYQVAREGECQTGCYLGENILLYAASNANVNLVKYIVEHADPKILELRDVDQRTALQCVMEAFKPAEKTIACARILVEAGIDMNAYTDSNKCDSVGYAILRLVHEETVSTREQYRLLAELFIVYGAAHAYSSAFTTGKNDTVGAFGIDDDYEKQECLKNKCIRVFKDIRKSVEETFWVKARVLVRGSSDQNSPLASLPQDIQKILLQKIWMNNAPGN